jgi:hypothetical protein
VEGRSGLMSAVIEEATFTDATVHCWQRSAADSRLGVERSSRDR